MQKKLMLRPTAVPSEHLPSEMTSYIERSDSPDNTSSSFVSLEQVESSTSSSLVSPNHHHQVAPIITNGNGNINNNLSNILINNNINNNNNNSSNTINNNHTSIINNNSSSNNNNGNHHHSSEYHHQEDVNVKLVDNYAYHQNSTPIVQQATNVVTYQQPSSYETLLTPLSTVPYQEINEAPMYMISDGTEIDQTRLASVLNKDGDYGDGTITYVVNFVDY